LIFDKVTDKNTLALLYGPWCICEVFCILWRY